MPYNETFADHFENPRNTGSLEEQCPDVGTGVVGSPKCGDIMKFQIRVGPDGRITEAKFKTFGCGAAIASGSLATEWIKGKTIDEAVKIKDVHIGKELELPPNKIHCSVMTEHAVQTAIDDWKKKNGKL